MTLSRRQFTAGAGALLGAGSLMSVGAANAARNNELNILCWEGYNSEQVLGPYRKLHPDATIRAESGTSDPDMVNKLRAGEIRVWDLINLNQPWARGQLYSENLIKPLDKDRFMPYFQKMRPAFAEPPYPLAFADNGDLLGMPQRYGPFSFVVNTDKISRKTAEDEGWNLFFDEKMKGRYGVLTYDNWNIIHMCMAAGLNPFQPIEGDNQEKFKKTAQQIFGNARLLTDDLVAMNTALINGEIDAYFTGGTHTASSARFDGLSNVRAITPNSGPIDGKGGIVWVELTSAVNNPNPSELVEDFLEFVQTPEVAHAVAFAEGTYNPVAQMGDDAVMAQFTEDELDAIQMDSLAEDISRSADYDVVTSYDALINIYTQVRRS